VIKAFVKFNLVSVIFLYFTGCNNPVPQPQQGAGKLVFSSGVQAACDNNMETKGTSRSYNTKATKCAELISSKFEGEILTVVLKQSGFCSSKFNLSSEISAGKVMLRADDTSTEAARCMCNFPLTYTFSGAKDTSYKLDYSAKVFNNDSCNSTFEIKK
jgi:hypothetical protein